jgi:hypothetical protein
MSAGVARAEGGDHVTIALWLSPKVVSADGVFDLELRSAPTAGGRCFFTARGESAATPPSSPSTFPLWRLSASRILSARVSTAFVLACAASR